jgi:hypothetical protein
MLQKETRSLSDGFKQLEVLNVLPQTVQTVQLHAREDWEGRGGRSALLVGVRRGGGCHGDEG